MRIVVRAACLLMLVPVAVGCRSVESRKHAYLESANRYVAAGKYREAVVEYRNAIQLDERFGEARARLASAYEHLGDGPHALGEYVRAADLLPDNLELQLTAGNYLLAAQRFEEAQARAQRVLARDSTNLQAQVLLGNALGGLQKFDEAIAEIEQAIRLDPERAASYAQLGALQLGRGQAGAAEEAFKKAVTLAPKWIPGHLALANYYWSKRDFATAEQTLRDALSIEPGNPLTNRAMALLLIATSRVAEAEPYVKVLSAAGAPFSLVDYYMATGRAATAVPELQRLRTAEATRDGATHRLARAYALQRDWTNVHTVADDVLVRNPRDAEMLLIKGQVLLRQGQRAEALERLKQAAQADSSSASVQFALGQAFAALSDFDEARKAYTEALKLDGRMARAQVELARLDLHGGQAESAVRRSREAVDAAPANLDAQLVLARSLVARGDVAAAEQVLAPLLQTHPDVAAVHVERAMASAAKKDTAAARASFERALALDPQLVSAIGGLVGLDLARRDEAAARARIDSALAAQPARPELLLIAARTHAASRDFDAAEKLLRRAIQIDPSLLSGYTMLGQLFVAQRKLDDAKREFQIVADKQPKPVAPLTMLGMIAQIQGDQALARKQFERVLVLDPRAPIAANNLAWMYAEQGENLETALQLAQNAVEALPKVAAVHDTLGWVYYKKQMPERAVAALTESVTREPQNAQFHYHLGLARKQAGDELGARQSLEHALKLNATFDGSADARRVLAELTSAGNTSRSQRP